MQNGWIGACLGIEGNIVSGWVIPQFPLPSPPVVELLIHSLVVASARCEFYSRELAHAGFGDGHHAFAVRIPDSVLPENYGDLNVRIQGTQIFLEHSARIFTAGSGSASHSCLEGHIDEAQHMQLRGWAWHMLRPNDPVALDMLIDGVFNRQIICADFRPDLLLHKKGNGCHGFHLPLPLILLDGKPHELRLRFSNSDEELMGSPIHLTGLSILPSHIVQQAGHLMETLADQVKSMTALVSSPNRQHSIEAPEKKQLEYASWVQSYDTLTDSDRAAIFKHIQMLKNPPLISVIMPTYNTPEHHLRAAIESIRQQLYPHWQLCIAEDASTQSHVLRVIKEYADLDPRIVVLERTCNGHISEASNSALSLAKGEYVAFLDHDDVLSEHALYFMAEAICRTDADLLYSDEDKIDEHGIRYDPHFKPDWNYHYLLAINYICHLCVIRRVLVEQVGGFRKECDGSQDHDLLLRISHVISPDKIHHIPHILYHWRSSQGSTALSDENKPYALQSRLKAISEHVLLKDKHATFSFNAWGACDVVWSLPKKPPLVSIIIPTRDAPELVAMCIASIEQRTDYENYEIILVDNLSEQPETFALFRELKRNPKISILPYTKPFNYSSINNLAVKHAKGDLICFVNNDIEVITPDWLSRMVALVVQPNVGAVGAKLLYQNQTVQHGGVIMGIGGVAGHFHRALPKDDPGYHVRALCTQNLSGVTAACLLTHKSIFLELKGFDEKRLPVSFNDVDLCLKIRKAGYDIIWSAHSVLYHYESLSRGQEDTPEKKLRASREQAVMRERWKKELQCDPFYNTNLSLDFDTQFVLAAPPRAEKPWKKRIRRKIQA